MLSFVLNLKLPSKTRASEEIKIKIETICSTYSGQHHSVMSLVDFHHNLSVGKHKEKKKDHFLHPREESGLSSGC